MTKHPLINFRHFIFENGRKNNLMSKIRTECMNYINVPGGCLYPIWTLRKLNNHSVTNYKQIILKKRFFK